jgi:endoglucanase
MPALRPLRQSGWRIATALAAAAALLPATGCAPLSPDPVTRLYAFPGNPLATAAAQLQATGQPAQAATLRDIARTPSGLWAAGQPGEMQQIRNATAAAARAHAILLVVAYNLPYRDACGQYSASARMPAAAYQRWIGELAQAIGDGQDIVVVEPDGLPDIVRGCLSPARSTERYRLLRCAMRVLGRLPHARVYLDAGNPGMFADPARLATPLIRAGVRYGQGFSVNVSNFQWTQRAVGWSQRLELALGGDAAAVVDTSRNGRGPYTGPAAPQWCNPPGRALGRRPQLDPGPAGIDAYLWVKDPGASDGPCNGGPPAGQYWPQYALALAAASSTPAPPPGRAPPLGSSRVGHTASPPAL